MGETAGHLTNVATLERDPTIMTVRSAQPVPPHGGPAGALPVFRSHLFRYDTVTDFSCSILTAMTLAHPEGVPECLAHYLELAVLANLIKRLP